MKSTEFLMELSPQTLASYKKKAGAQASELDKSAFDKDTPDDIAKKQIAKANKRFSGIVKATKKEFDKPKEVEEGQIYSGGNKEAGVRWYEPRHVPNQNELEGVAEDQLDEKCWDTHKQVGMKKKGGKMVPNCVPKESAIMKGLLK